MVVARPSAGRGVSVGVGADALPPASWPTRAVKVRRPPRFSWPRASLHPWLCTRHICWLSQTATASARCTVAGGGGGPGKFLLARRFNQGLCLPTWWANASTASRKAIYVLSASSHLAASTVRGRGTGRVTALCLGRRAASTASVDTRLLVRGASARACVVAVWLPLGAIGRCRLRPSRRAPRPQVESSPSRRSATRRPPNRRRTWNHGCPHSWRWWPSSLAANIDAGGSRAAPRRSAGPEERAGGATGLPAAADHSGARSPANTIAAPCSGAR